MSLELCTLNGPGVTRLPCHLWLVKAYTATLPNMFFLLAFFISYGVEQTYSNLIHLWGA